MYKRNLRHNSPLSVKCVLYQQQLSKVGRAWERHFEAYILNVCIDIERWQSHARASLWSLWSASANPTAWRLRRELIEIVQRKQVLQYQMSVLVCGTHTSSASVVRLICGLVFVETRDINNYGITLLLSPEVCGVFVKRGSLWGLSLFNHHLMWTCIWTIKKSSFSLTVLQNKKHLWFTQLLHTDGATTYPTLV